MTRKRNFFKKKRDFGPRKNEYIKVPEVFLIDQNNENHGVVATAKAYKMAQEAGLDLVEVSPMAKPPVCRILDFAKYMYEQKKKTKKSKSSGKTKPQKEFKFTPVIDVGDMEYRVRRAIKYLEKGHQVRITMFRKGRQSQDQAKETFDKILTFFTDYSKIEAEPRREGRKFFVTYKPQKNGKTKNKKDSSEEISKEQSEGEQKS